MKHNKSPSRDMYFEPPRQPLSARRESVP